MNRFAKSGSLLFRLVTSLFLATLFCDGANLDDLFPNCVVLHDDDEIVAASQGVEAAPASDTLPMHRIPWGFKQPGRPSTHPAAILHVVIDQDSPSLAAHGFYSTHSAPADLSEPGTPPLETRFATGLLYLRYHSLLI